MDNDFLCLLICLLALCVVNLLPLVGICFTNECFPFIIFKFLVVAAVFFCLFVCLETSLEHLLSSWFGGAVKLLISPSYLNESLARKSILGWV